MNKKLLKNVNNIDVNSVSFFYFCRGDIFFEREFIQYIEH